MRSKPTKDELSVYLLFAVAFIVGLIWLQISRSSNDTYAPCSKYYVGEHGVQDCEDYQEQLNQQDYRDCGFKPAC